MVYEIGSSTMLFEIDRTAIVDISVGDTVFMESNPDAKVFLKLKRDAKGTYEAAGITVITES
jgi:hypothetical protein